ncbi:hypothetical protein BJ508DRAFT_303841 [Ascobolus immersus RN42]|uniref:Uncharacterized protein n=1 Tax=Ascobolus immersus RN42 TaxID=1160509 RepID=A0A3N4II43_ASCIM|nr:hypothetical protein BJ508DRAFT_303841 [Ascobolus immersus RN42]
MEDDEQTKEEYVKIESQVDFANEGARCFYLRPNSAALSREYVHEEYRERPGARTRENKRCNASFKSPIQQKVQHEGLLVWKTLRSRWIKVEERNEQALDTSKHRKLRCNPQPDTCTPLSITNCIRRRDQHDRIKETRKYLSRYRAAYEYTKQAEQITKIKSNKLRNYIKKIHKLPQREGTTHTSFHRRLLRKSYAFPQYPKPRDATLGTQLKSPSHEKSSYFYPILVKEGDTNKQRGWSLIDGRKIERANLSNEFTKCSQCAEHRETSPEQSYALLQRPGGKRRSHAKI